MYASSNPIVELSAMCEHIIAVGMLGSSGKRLLTTAWIKACCRQPDRSKKFPLDFSRAMRRAERDYTVDVKLVEAFTRAFGSAEKAQHMFFDLVSNTNDLLDLYQVLTSAGPVHVEDAVLRRALEGAPTALKSQNCYHCMFLSR